MRILYVIQELRTGGAERVVATLAREARAAGHDVALAAAPGPVAEELGLTPFPVPLLERRPWRVPAGALAVGRALRAWRPDLVHSHNPGMALATGLATRRGRRLPSLVSVHGVPEEDYPTAARVLRWAGLPTIACGPGVAEALLARGLPVAATIPNGIAPAPPPADRAVLEREWRIGREKPLVVAVGRLVEAKNHRLAVEALAGVPEAFLAILGDGPLRGELERQARESGVQDRVVFAGVREDARALMGAADAVVIPSRSEGLPLVALEALAAGTPIVATSIRGLRELLTEGGALLVPPEDPGALAVALRRVLTEPDLAGSLAAEGRRIAGGYTEDAMVGGFLDLYGKLLAERYD